MLAISLDFDGTSPPLMDSTPKAARIFFLGLYLVFFSLFKYWTHLDVVLEIKDIIVSYFGQY